MARKRYKAEEIVAKLRQVDVLTSLDKLILQEAARGNFQELWPNLGDAVKDQAATVLA